MYYHVILETTEVDSKGRQNSVYWFDCQDFDELCEDVIEPYVKKKELYISGRYIDSGNVHSLIIKSSSQPIESLVDAANNRNRARGVFLPHSKYTFVCESQELTDVTKELVKKKIAELAETQNQSSETSLEIAKDAQKKVFVVHGHDELAKTQMARFIEKVGLEPVILHEQVSSGMTIIEKIESYNGVGFAVVLYTPCDVGGSNKPDATTHPRARQNVVFEHGYFLGHLGRSKVSAFVKGDIETPNDINGVVYTPFDDAGAWKISLWKELKAAGYSVKNEF